MSDYLPFELQVEIIKKLPVKPLLQFRSVSKRWKYLIDSSKFVSTYSINQTQLQRLLVWYEDGYVYPYETGKKIVSFVDDETLVSIFPNKEIDPTTLGLSKLHKDLRVVGSSHGLFCLYDFNRDRSCYNSGTGMVVLWNPSIRKSVAVVVPRVLGWGFQQTVLGFWVCPITSDPTIVKITNVSMEMKGKENVPWVVEVFTLSTGSWRIPTSKFPDKPVTVTWDQVAIDKFIYWFAFYGVEDFGFGAYKVKVIMSFDMTTHEISLIDLPNCFAHQSSMNFSMSKVRGSLALLEYSTNNEKQVCDIWMMDVGVSNLFRKVLTINTPYESINILGFMKSGGPIMQTVFEYGEPAALVFYDASSNDTFNHTVIYAKYGSFFVDSYMETLLLLDQPDSSVYSISN